MGRRKLDSDAKTDAAAAGNDVKPADVVQEKSKGNALTDIELKTWLEKLVGSIGGGFDKNIQTVIKVSQENNMMIIEAMKKNNEDMAREIGKQMVTVLNAIDQKLNAVGQVVSQGQIQMNPGMGMQQPMNPGMGQPNMLANVQGIVDLLRAAGVIKPQINPAVIDQVVTNRAINRIALTESVAKTKMLYDSKKIDEKTYNEDMQYYDGLKKMATMADAQVIHTGVKNE